MRGLNPDRNKCVQGSIRSLGFNFTDSFAPFFCQSVFLHVKWPARNLSSSRLRLRAHALGSFEKGAFRPRIHRNGHTYPHVSGAFWKRWGPKTGLFKNAAESGSFENGGFGSGSLLRVNMVSGSFLPLFPRRSKMACPSDDYASCAFAVSFPKPVAAHFFLFRRELPSKTKRSMVAVVVRSNSTSSSTWTKVGCFVFVSYCFVFCLCFIRLWSISFITCLHHSQTTYTPSTVHKHVKQYRRKTLASKGNKQKRVRFELEASPSLST